MSAEPPAASAPNSEDPIGARYPNTARIWNYQLGGKDNFVVDREASEAANAMVRSLGVPAGADTAVEGRHLLQRVEQQHARREADPAPLLQLRHHLEAEQRVSSQLKEVIVNARHLNAEHLTPNFQQHRLRGRAWRLEPLCQPGPDGGRFRKRPTIDFSIWCEG